MASIHGAKPSPRTAGEPDPHTAVLGQDLARLLFFTFVADGVQDAVAHGVEAADERAVTVIGGADLTRELLAAGLVDESRVDVMPVLLSAGLRLFDGTGPMCLKS